MTIVTDINTGVYTITNRKTGRVYIGCTTSSFDKRWEQHRNSLARGKHCNGALQQDWNVYGPQSFGFAIAERIASKLDVWQREVYLIETAQAPLYNVRSSIQSRMIWARKRHSEVVPAPKVALPELLTVEEVAAKLRISEQTVVRHIKAGTLPAVKVGSQWRIAAEEVAALLAPGRRSTPDPGEARA